VRGVIQKFSMSGPSTQSLPIPIASRRQENDVCHRLNKLFRPSPLSIFTKFACV
jgi:hypothetical protein